MTTQATEKPKRLSVIIPIARLSYPHLWAPQHDDNNDRDIYDFTAVWEPARTDNFMKLVPLLQLARAAKDQKWADAKFKVQSPFRIFANPIPALFQKHLEGFYQYMKGGEVPGMSPVNEGNITATFRCYSTKDRPIIPGIVGPDRKPLLNQADLYAGCYVIAEVTAFAYDRDGNKGVSFGLSHVMKVGDGEPLSAFKSAEDTFAEIDLDQYGVDNSALLNGNASGGVLDGI